MKWWQILYLGGCSSVVVLSLGLAPQLFYTGNRVAAIAFAGMGVSLSGLGGVLFLRWREQDEDRETGQDPSNREM